MFRSFIDDTYYSETNTNVPILICFNKKSV